MTTRKHRYRKNNRKRINTRRKKSRGKGFTARNYTKKSVEISNLPINKDTQKEILKNMKREDAATLIQSVHRKNHPRGYNITLFITPLLDTNFNHSRETMEVFKEWFDSKISNVREQGFYLNNEDISILNSTTLKVSFTVNSSKFDEVEMSIDSVLSLDDDGNYPIYIDRQKNIYIDKPTGNSKQSLIYIRENRGRTIKPYY